MSQFAVAVVAFEEGGDYIHWFPFVVVEFPETQDAGDLDNLLSLIPAKDVLDWVDEGDDEDEDISYEYSEKTPGRIKTWLQNAGADIIAVHESASNMTYIAPLE